MSCELFVGNLNPDVRSRDLENVFGRYGKIVRCDLKKNFGFIQYSERRDAEQALIKENDQKLLGSIMTVEWAKGSGPSQRGGGGRGGPGGPRYRSPQRGMRDRSPYGNGGRARSPRGFDRGGFEREDRFGGGGYGGGGRRSNGGRDRDFDSQRMDRGAPRERPRGGDRGERFNDSYGPPKRGPPGGDRRPPPRERPRGGERERSNRRDSFSNDRRSSFGGGGGGGPRRF